LVVNLVVYGIFLILARFFFCYLPELLSLFDLICNALQASTERRDVLSDADYVTVTISVDGVLNEPEYAKVTPLKIIESFYPISVYI